MTKSGCAICWMHAYFDINLEILWRTVQDDLPPLVAELEQIAPGELG